MSGPPPPPSTDALVEAIGRHLGTNVAAGELDLQWREWRWMALLQDHVAIVAASEAGWQRLCIEADLMEAGRQTTGALVPAVVLQDPELRLQLHERKTGIHGLQIEARLFGVPVGDEPPPLSRYSPACPLTDWGETFAASLGRALAQLHRGMRRARGATQLRRYVPDWSRIETVLRAHVGDDTLLCALRQLRAWDTEQAHDDVALHGDPHFHNLFADDDGRLTAVIDFDEACLGNFHEDLRYVHSEGPRFAEIAMAAYATEAGVPVDPQLVRRYHVRSAFDHFAWVAPESRRFPRMIRWATEATHALTPEWIR